MFPFAVEREERRWLALLALAAAAECAVLFAVSWSTAGGHFMLPLDDSYIHLQYAKRLAEGAALSYSPGMAPSGGMTSPGYVLALAPMFLLGLGGAKAAAGAFAFGAALWMLLSAWVFQLARRLTNTMCGAMAAGLVLANGHLLWNFLSGMETALFTVLLAGAILAAQAWWQSAAGYARGALMACLGALPLVRPEGAIVALALVPVVLVRRGEAPRLPLLPLLLSLAPLGIWLATLHAATGEWKPAGLIVKGMAEHPYLAWHEKLASAGQTLLAVGGRFYFNAVPDDAYAAFKGTTRLPYVAFLVGPLALLGACFAAVLEWRARRPAGGTLLGIVWLGGLASLAASWLPFIQQQRYLAPWTVLAIVLAMTMLRRIAQLFEQHEGTMLKAAGLAWFLVSVPSLGFWIHEYGRNARDIYHLHRVATFRLAGSEVPMAVTDAGVLAYYTDARVWDLVGLASAEFPRAALQGEGATLEALSRLPGLQRPRTAVTFREWFSPAFPLAAAEWTTAIARTSITSGTALGSFPIRWQEIEDGDRPPLAPGTGLLASADVADLASEAEMDYRFELGPYDVAKNAWPQPLCIAASEAFTSPAEQKRTASEIVASKDYLTAAIPPIAERREREVRAGYDYARAFLYVLRGEIVGERTYYADGALESESPLKAGRPHGVVRRYYPNGSVREELPHRDGLLHGACRVWDPAGRLLGEYRMSNGTGIVREWWPGGARRSEASYVRGKREGYFRLFHEDGSIKSIGEFRDDKPHGVQKDYFATGLPERELAYRGGKLHGIVRTWDRLGNLSGQLPEFYLDGFEVSPNEYYRQRGTAQPPDEILRSPFYPLDTGSIDWLAGRPDLPPPPEDREATLRIADGARCVRADSFLFEPQDRLGSAVYLYLRVGAPELAGSPGPAARALKVTVVSNTTGFSAERRIALPEGAGLNTLVLDITDALDEAGGTAWRIRTEAAEPSGAAFLSAHYWIVRR